MVFRDAHRQLISLAELAYREAVVDYFTAPCTAIEIVAHVKTLLENVWHDRWIKSPKKKNFTKPAPAKIVKGGHTSIFRIIQLSKSKPKIKPPD